MFLKVSYEVPVVLLSQWNSFALGGKAILTEQVHFHLKKSITEIDCSAHTWAYEKKRDRECKPFIICLQIHSPQRPNFGLIICSNSLFSLALAEGSGD